MRPVVMPAPSIVPIRERAPAASLDVPSQGRATVVELDADAIVLERGAQRFGAQRAASCLLSPEPGDRVWFVAEQAEVHVIAVLERAATSPAQLRVDGDAQLQASGRLSIDGAAGLELRSEAQVAVNADELQLRARLGRIVFEQCSAVLRTLFTHVGEATFVAKLLETLADRVRAHAKTSHRTVESLDHLEAGAIDYRAEREVQISASHTLVRASELVKVDGGQIHLG